MKKSKLEELLKLITKKVIKEFQNVETPVATKVALQGNLGTSIDPKTPEQQRKDRIDAEHNRVMALKAAKGNAEVAKAEIDLDKKKRKGNEDKYRQARQSVQALMNPQNKLN